MSLYDELDLLDEAQKEAEQVAETMVFDSDLDRRKFVFMSVTAAAATTFGFGAKALAQGGAGGAAGAAGAPAGRGGGGGRGGQGGAPPVPIDNMENVSWTFQPYPGGTGALLEKTYREKGAAAFNRQKFSWTPDVAGAFYIEPWGTAALPSTDEEIAFLPAYRLAAAIKAGKLTSTRITKIYIERLKKYNPVLECAVTILEEQGLAAAAAADAEIKAGKYRGPLHGIPWGVKDLFAAKGTPTTWGAGDFKDRTFDFDSEVVARLKGAGAVLIAKLATGQFAEGNNWEYGNKPMTTRNPWNTTQGASGSSCGPGSATAAGCVAFGIGTETNGSIVGPTGTNGLCCIRPTFGRVSRAGGMVLAWSQDRVGPLTRTSKDAAMVFNVIHGADEKDPGTITMPFHFNNNINLANLRIGVRPQPNGASAELQSFIDKLKELGAKPKDIPDPPRIGGAGDGLEQESAAAFDSYVQFKAKEMGVDVNSLNGGGGGRGGGRGAGAPPDSAAAAAAAGRGGGGGGGGRGAGRAPVIAPDGHQVIDGQLSRWTGIGRTQTAMDFINRQRRRLIAITAWQEYLKDTDLYIGASDTGPHAMTGHPVSMVQIGFGVGGGRGGGGGGRGGAAGRGGAPAAAAPGAPAAPPAPQLAYPGGPALTSGNPQPHCTQIAGNLYNDDLIVSVAHKFQTHVNWLKERPKMDW